MSQYDFSNLSSPLTGQDLIDTHLEPWRDALHSSHSGTTRPSYAVAGTIWLDNSSTPWELKMFDGTDDICIGTINATSNLFTPDVIGTIWCGTSGGTANAQTFTPSRAISSYATGQAFEGVMSLANTTAGPTINISSIGVKTVKYYTSAGKVNIPIGALQGICRFVYDGTDLILINSRPYNQGTAIATATTLNLDNATGDFVHLTGTTTVTNITLSQGRRVACVSDGAFTLTDGSGNSPQDIVLPGAANISVAAGDVFVCRGDANGTVIVESYTKADGTALVASAAGRLIGTQAFTASSGTYTPTAGTNTIRYMLIGASAGGGGDSGGTAGGNGGTSSLVSSAGTVASTTAATGGDRGRSTDPMTNRDNDSTGTIGLGDGIAYTGQAGGAGETDYEGGGQNDIGQDGGFGATCEGSYDLTSTDKSSGMSYTNGAAGAAGTGVTQSGKAGRLIVYEYT